MSARTKDLGIGIVVPAPDGMTLKGKTICANTYRVSSIGENRNKYTKAN
jgi:hypothetical protein